MYDLSKEMILNKILLFAASIIKLFILILFFSNSNADENNFNYFPSEMGSISLMYHRFDETKYPSTNIQMDVFKKQINIIKKNYPKNTGNKEAKIVKIKIGNGYLYETRFQFFTKKEAKYACSRLKKYDRDCFIRG